jgi:hypothetical protein
MPNCKDIPLDMWGNRNNYERNAMDSCSNGIKADIHKKRVIILPLTTSDFGENH